MTPEEIELLWADFEHYVYKVKHYMGMGTGITQIKLWYQFLEWRGE